MQNKEVLDIINKLIKYDLKDYFTSKEELDNWLDNLDGNQIKRFLDLKLNTKRNKYINKFILDLNLLRLNDYEERLKILLTWNCTSIEIVSSIYRSGLIFSSSFYYKNTLIYRLISNDRLVSLLLKIGVNDNFWLSPYLNHDLELLFSLNDKSDETLEKLMIVILNENSINSKYHENDVNLIGNLIRNNSLISDDIIILATSKASLNDMYHIANMNILKYNPLSSSALRECMTNPNIIKGIYYRDEIEALSTAVSINNMEAIIFYMQNYHGLEFFVYEGSKENDDNKHQSVVNDPNYLNNLKLLSKMKSKYAPYYACLFINPLFTDNYFQSFDLDILSKLEDDEDKFILLWKIFKNKYFINSPYHKRDALIIFNSNINNDLIRELLLREVTNQKCIRSFYHEYDLEYLLRLDKSLDRLKLLPNYDLIIKKIIFYLFDDIENNNPKHKEYLESLLKGKVISEVDTYIEEIISSTEYNEEEYKPLNTILPKKNNLCRKLTLRDQFKKMMAIRYK